MKRILGLDLGTNSIGWALVEVDHEKKMVRIIGLGSRILSMDANEIATFETGGKLASSAAQRTEKRSPRRLNERYLLRRDRLHCVLNLLQCLPEHYCLSIEFENEKRKRSGKFKKGIEEKLAYYKDDNGKYQFLFMNAYQEMENEFRQQHPNLFHVKNNGKQIKIPYDWTLYYLRKKALQATNNELTKEELAWITLSFNQKRGYEKVIGQDEKEQKDGELRETFTGKVKNVTKIDDKDLYEIVLVDFKNEDNELYRYKEESKIQITFKDDLKEVEIVSKYDDEGNVDGKNAEYIINEIRESLLILDVRNTGRKNKENFIFEIELETGWIKEQQSKFTPKWKDAKRDFIIKTKYDKDGNRMLKGQDKGRNISIPKEEDWSLMKLKTETSIHAFNTKYNTIGVAPFIYYNLLQNPNQKIKAGLVTVIERDFYEKELKAIYKLQEKFHPELKNRELYKQAIELLYPNNKTHRGTLANLDFKDLIGTDILFYQRDLKSKKSLIADCEYETRTYFKAGVECKQALKAIHAANPLYQEFRLWQFIKSLKIIKREDVVSDEILLNQDVSGILLTLDIKEKIFEFLNNKKEITQIQLLKKLSELHNDKTISFNNYKWNYPQYDDEEKKNEHKIVCNPTRYEFILRTKKIKNFDWKTFLNTENEYLLWHFFYSVKKKNEFLSGLNSLVEKLLKRAELPEDYKNDLVKSFSTFSGYKNDYGTYSEKAIKKLLPFLRLGKYWKQEDVENILANRPSDVSERFEKVLDNVIEKEGINGEITDFQGLWLSSACYLVYGRHSEVGDVKFWTSPYDIENFIRNEFRQHSLNNPVVEKVLIETLQVVKDIWIYYGEKDGIDENGKSIYKKLFDRIHIELGREMKKNNKQKQNEDRKNSENRKANERIIELLKELKKEYGIVQEKSPFQQAKLKILEEGLLSSIEYDKDNVSYELFDSQGKITKKEIKELVNKDITKVSKGELERYKLWLDQRYQSPYTGKIISLSDLFDRTKYEIEHIFPQERVTLNSLNNKVICETEVNKDKKADTGYGYILRAKEKEIFCAAHGKKVHIQSVESYEKLVKANFIGEKREILLSKDIPDEFTNSLKVNMQYISKMAVKLLSNIVREKDEDTYRSKNVLATNGTITSTLKKHWQLNEMWNELMSPRYKRMNELTKSILFGDTRLIDGHEVFVNDNQIPQQINKNFDPKRIDHRHHALDALIIALTTENHVNYLNNISSQENGEDKLKMRKAIKYQLTNTRKGQNEEKEWYFLPPAQLRTKESIINYDYQYKSTNGNVFKDIAKVALEDTIASFKQKNRIIRQRWNKYSTYEDGKLVAKEQDELKEKGKFSIRQSLHKSTFYGKVKLAYKTLNISLNRAISEDYDIVDSSLCEHIKDMKKKMSKNEIITQLSVNHPTVKVYDKFVSTRYGCELESLAAVSSNKIISTIESITDTGIQEILKNHLKNYDFNPQTAFSYDGIKTLNEAIIKPKHGLTKKGKPHKPIYKVRMADAMGTKFSVSENGQKSTKYVVTDAGSNAFCGIYKNKKDSERKFYIPALKEILNNLKNGENPCPGSHPDFPEYYWSFNLCANDLVYLPTQDEIENNIPINIDSIDKSRIYKFTDGSGTTLNFVPVNTASLLYGLSKKDAEKLKKEHSLEYEDILQNEFGLGSPQSKNQNSIDGIQIKKYCIKLNIDRLGNIKSLL
jgi:CRISPR-associated endonuclease Csn1